MVVPATPSGHFQHEEDIFKTMWISMYTNVKIREHYFSTAENKLLQGPSVSAAAAGRAIVLEIENGL